MSATMTQQTSADEGVDPGQDRAAAVNALAGQLYAGKITRNNSKAPAERAKETQLWKEAHTEAKRVIRSEAVKAKTKATAKAAATSARAEASSALHRNRAQLAPWLLAAPYAGLGEAAWLLAEYGSGNPAGIGVLTAAAAAGGSCVAWTKKLRERVPGRLRQKVQAGLGLASGWAGTMPLVDGAGQAGMWLALLGGTGYLGLSWWREHDHPIPLPREQGEPDAPAPAEPAGDAASRRIAGILRAWHDKLAAKGKAVPYSSLVHVSSTDAVDEYLITLDDEGTVTGEHLEGLKGRISMAIGVQKHRLTFESGTHPAQVIMRHLVHDPVFAYTEPIVLCNGTPIHSRWEVTPGADVDIVFGSYLDGKGQARYRFITKGSVNSAFLLGGMGSGKTRTAEVIAIGLRLLGCYLLWLDGQGGGSSPVLNEFANEAFEFNMHDRADDRGAREFTAALGAISGKRNQDLKDHPELGGAYVYDPHRPPVVALMDEAHELFQTQHPTEGTYGHRLGAYASQIRKCGMAMVALSQDYDKAHTFGGDSRLREGLVTSGNLIAMKQQDRSRVGMLPSNCPPLDTVPDVGYGYLPLQARPDALWRTLDLGKNDQDTVRRWMSHYEPAVLEFDRATTGQADTDDDAEAEDASAHRVVRFPGAAEPEPVDAVVAALTEAEQRALAVIQGAPQNPTTLAAHLGIRQQGAGKTLRRLAAKRVVVKMEDGRYMAR